MVVSPGSPENCIGTAAILWLLDEYGPLTSMPRRNVPFGIAARLSGNNAGDCRRAPKHRMGVTAPGTIMQKDSFSAGYSMNKLYEEDWTI